MAAVTVTGVVLAGGASTRMGRDKALLVVEGQRLVDRAVATLRTCCDFVVVASGERTIAGVDAEQIPDEIVGVGPLGGICAAMNATSAEVLAVLAVDLPDASAAVFGSLIDRWSGEPALVPVADGRPQPLHALWSTSVADDLRDLLGDGERRVLAALDALGATFVEIPGPYTRNLNRPDDL